MIERRPFLDILAHAILIIGVAIVAFPVYLTLVASIQSAQEIAQSRPLSLLPVHFLESYRLALGVKPAWAAKRLPAAP